MTVARDDTARLLLGDAIENDPAIADDICDHLLWMLDYPDLFPYEQCEQAYAVMKLGEKQ